MTITCIRWLDAAYGQDEVEFDETGLAHLWEVGFLLREDEHSVTVSMEHQEGATTTRNWICVPKSGIVERRDLSFEQFQQMLKKRRGVKS